MEDQDEIGASEGQDFSRGEWTGGQGWGLRGARGMSRVWLSPRVELKILREDESLGNVL